MAALAKDTASIHAAQAIGRVWIEDGILYTELLGDLSLKNVLTLEVQALTLFTEQQVAVIPNVVLLDKITGDKIKIGAADFSKLFSTFEVLRHLSAVLMVCPSDRVRRTISHINRLFFGNRIRFFPTLAEAQSVARQCRSLTLPILEQDRMKT